MTLAKWDDRGEEMNQEADQDVVDEVSEEVDSRGKVMRSEMPTFSKRLDIKFQMWTFNKHLLNVWI